MNNIETDKEQLRVLRTAAKALKRHEKLKAELKAHENYLSLVCQSYGNAYRVWGVRPEHLRQACIARGLMT